MLTADLLDGLVRGDDLVAGRDAAAGQAVVVAVDDEIGDAAELLAGCVAAVALLAADAGEIDDDGEYP